MNNNEKKLGNYIEQTNIRNVDLSVKDLLGVSIDKKFIKSIANTIGTDFSKYKVVEYNQFAYGPVTSRNGDKISIALQKELDKCIISSSYIPFKIINLEELNPEYLMLIFSKPEFDRYARYNSWGSAREVFSWDDLCETKINIPSMNKQLEIVNKYNKIEKMINNTQASINMLEKLLLTYYNGIEKKQNITLNKLTLNNKGIKTGKSANSTKEKKNEYIIPVIGAAGIIGYTNNSMYNKRIISTGRVGTIGKIMLWDEDIWFTDNSLIIETEYISTVYCILKQFDFNEILGGSSNPKITQSDLGNIKINVPSNDMIEFFENKAKPIIDYLLIQKKELDILLKTQEILITSI